LALVPGNVLVVKEYPNSAEITTLSGESQLGQLHLGSALFLFSLLPFLHSDLICHPANGRLWLGSVLCYFMPFFDIVG
jgi:hypothetical protein